MPLLGLVLKGSLQGDGDNFSMSLRKFLKQVGVTSHQEIERIVRDKGLRGKGLPPRHHAGSR